MSFDKHSHAVRLLHHKVAAAAMLQMTYNRHAFTRTRMQRVPNQNFKRLFSGGMSR